MQVIVNKSTISQKHLQLFNIAGQLLLQKSWSGAPIDLNISDLPAGVYFVKIEIERRIQTDKIVIVR